MYAAYQGHYAARRIRGYDPGRTRPGRIIPEIRRGVPGSGRGRRA